MKSYIAVSPVLLALSLTTNATKPKKSKHPNLIIIMADQWRGDALGFLNREPVHTPNLDRLAQEGVSFNQAVSSYPVSSPARAMFMSGMYPFNNGVPLNCHSGNKGVELHEAAVCWSDILKRQHYATAYIGKWHLDMPYAPYIDCSNNRGQVKWNEWCPPHRRHGFDEWIAYGTYDYHLKPMYWSRDAKRHEYQYVEQWGPSYETDQAIDFIAAHKDTTFALMISMNPPHTGYDLVPNSYKSRYNTLNVDSLAQCYPNLQTEKQKTFFKNNVRNYYACITGVDDCIGRLLAYVTAQGLRNNTLIVFTSDHGDMMNMHGVIGKNTFHEAAMRIPLIISQPGHIQPRMDNQTLIALQDLYPTILELMGHKNQIPNTVQTCNLAKHVRLGKGKTPTCQPYFKMEKQEGNKPVNGWRGIRTLQHTYACHFVEGERVEVHLYDRENDPFQLHNIATTAPAKLLKEMETQLLNELKRTDDPLLQHLRL